MKTTIVILLLSSLSLFAQNVAVLTHQAANSEKFQAGFPGGWPYARPVEIGTRTNLPPELSAPWVVMTRAALDAQMASLQPAVDAWVPPDAPDVAARRQLIADIVTDLRAIRQSSGTLTGAQMSNALRRISTLLLILLDEERVNLK